MKVNNISSQLIGYDFLKKKETQKCIEENQKMKNDYFECSNEYQGKDSIGRRLDLTYLLTSDAGFLSGSLSDERDVDYYQFSIASFRNLNMVEKYNKDIVINLENIPADCQYEIILYDEEGNQVGIGTDGENGTKSICIPNWDNSTEFYVKVFSMNGAASDKYYHLSFDVMEGTKKSGAYLQNKEKSKYLADFRHKLHVGEDYSKEKAALEAIDEKYRNNYYKQMEKLHTQQVKDLNISAGEDVKVLLDRYTKGEEITEEEKKILMVYATAKEHDMATITRELNEKVMSVIKVGLEKNISGETFFIRVEKDGEVSLTGGRDEETENKIRKILGEKFSDLLRESYILVSEETERIRCLKNMSLDEYSSFIDQCTAKYIISNNYIRVLG